jgi:hypothetical protein
MIMMERKQWSYEEVGGSKVNMKSWTFLFIHDVKNPVIEF